MSCAGSLRRSRGTQLCPPAPSRAEQQDPSRGLGTEGDEPVVMPALGVPLTSVTAVSLVWKTVDQNQAFKETCGRGGLRGGNPEPVAGGEAEWPPLPTKCQLPGWVTFPLSSSSASLQETSAPKIGWGGTGGRGSGSSRSHVGFPDQLVIEKPSRLRALAEDARQALPARCHSASAGRAPQSPPVVLGGSPAMRGAHKGCRKTHTPPPPRQSSEDVGHSAAPWEGNGGSQLTQAKATQVGYMGEAGGTAAL